MQIPLISVIIPSYNSRGGLFRSIESALNQTYKNLEILVVDDNNPDTPARINTEAIMSYYEANPKVKYIKHEYNKNGAAARNTGIKAANGEYIAFLDDDDEWLEDKLCKQLDYLLAHKDFDCVYCYSSINDKKEYTIPYEGNCILPLLMNRTKMFTPSLMFTRSSLISIGGFDETFRRHQDYELLVKFFSRGYKICCLKEVLTIVHSLGGNTPSIEDFILLKDRFLKVFSPIIEELDGESPGIKNKIIAANYAVVWDAAIVSGRVKLANEVFKKSFHLSPMSFISQIIFICKGRIIRKLLKA